MALGDILREKREAMNLTQMNVAEITKLPLERIKDLENNDFSRVAAPIYGIGFIKAYARLLKLDSTPLVEEFNELYNNKDRVVPLVPMEVADNDTGTISTVNPSKPNVEITVKHLEPQVTQVPEFKPIVTVKDYEPLVYSSENDSAKHATTEQPTSLVVECDGLKELEEKKAEQENADKKHANTFSLDNNVGSSLFGNDLELNNNEQTEEEHVAEKFERVDDVVKENPIEPQISIFQREQERQAVAPEPIPLEGKPFIYPKPVSSVANKESREENLNHDDSFVEERNTQNIFENKEKNKSEYIDRIKSENKNPIGKSFIESFKGIGSKIKILFAKEVDENESEKDSAIAVTHKYRKIGLYVSIAILAIVFVSFAFSTTKEENVEEAVETTEVVEEVLETIPENVEVYKVFDAPKGFVK